MIGNARRCRSRACGAPLGAPSSDRMPVMHESDRNARLKRQKALLLAASDMEQAVAAARALQREHDDVWLMRALETAIAVSYARAFTQSNLLQLDRDEYRPTAEAFGRWHDDLYALRDSVYAHTDPKGGRDATARISSAVGFEEDATQPATVHVEWREQWVPIPREDLPQIIELCVHQRDRFRQEASAIQAILDNVRFPAIPPRELFRERRRRYT